MENQEISDETLQYMHSTPLFNLEQQRRFEYLKQVGSEITTIAQHFNSYADIGHKLCSGFGNLRNTFNNMEFICTDATIKPLREIFEAVDGAFSHHFQIVTDTIVRPLNDFVTKELEKIGNYEREHQKNLAAFHAAEEKYVTMKPQTKEALKQEREQALVQTHTCSTLAFFEFCMKMESVELKLRSILPQMFMSFLSSVSAPFTNCIDAMADKKEYLATTETTITEVNQKVLDFSNHSVQIKQNVSSQIPVFWERLRQPFTGTSSTSIQGYLWKKKSGSLSKSWHKRFFMLSNGVLSWAKTVDEALRSQKNLAVVYCSVKPEPNAQRNNCFSLSNNKKVMVLQARTNWDMNNWLVVIQNSILSQLNSNPDADDALPPASTVVDTVCADCGAPNSAWASINWGVTLCEACCADHRHLGSAFTQARSLQLDALDPMQRALCEAIGTERSNEVLEAAVGDAKITPQTDIETRKEYIRRKYKGKEFTGEIPEIDIFKAIQEQDIMTVYRYVAAGRLAEMKSGSFTPLHAGAVVGNPLIMQLLCLNSITMDVLDEKGWTPVSYAAYYEQPAMLDVLTMNGADIGAGNVNAYDIAKYKNNEHMMMKLASVMDASKYEEGVEYKPEHDELHSEKFVFSDFVADPSVYLTVKPTENRVMTKLNKKRLNSAVNVLRTRLSMQNSHQKQLLASSDEEDDLPSPKLTDSLK